MSSNIYLQRDQPAYRIGHGVVLAYLFLFLFCGSGLQWWYLARENQKRRNGERDHWVQGKSKEEIARLGDFRFVSAVEACPLLFKLTSMQTGLYVSDLITSGIAHVII